MTKIITKVKNFIEKGLAPYGTKGSRSGFVILFAVTLTSIVLAVSLGVANVSLKELKFGTSVKDTNNAFLSSDTGIECALFYDKSGASSFPIAGPATNISCAALTPTYSFSSGVGTYNFVINNLGSGASCAKVSVIKDSVVSAPYILTTIISKGYNIGDPGTCDSTSLSRVEREVRVADITLADWRFCAAEGGTCNFTGNKQVRYGRDGYYFYRNATNSIACDTATFGDPIQGGPAKHCDYSF